MTKLVWAKTTDQLPADTQELIGYGAGLSQNLYGMYSIMRYDGCWWSADGTELSDPPEYWAYLNSPNDKD